MPVLPVVPSMMVMPGRKVPLRSAASTMAGKIRSLTLPEGPKYSSLTRICVAEPSSTRRKRTIGVSPPVSRTLSATRSRRAQSTMYLSISLPEPRLGLILGATSQLGQLVGYLCVVVLAIPIRDFVARSQPHSRLARHVRQALRQVLVSKRLASDEWMQAHRHHAARCRAIAVQHVELVDDHL